MSARQLHSGPSATRAASKTCSSVTPSPRLIDGATSQASVSPARPGFGTQTASSVTVRAPKSKRSERPDSQSCTARPVGSGRPRLSPATWEV